MEIKQCFAEVDALGEWNVSQGLDVARPEGFVRMQR
jgi:hypothetical protein